MSIKTRSQLLVALGFKQFSQLKRNLQRNLTRSDFPKVRFQNNWTNTKLDSEMLLGSSKPYKKVKFKVAAIGHLRWLERKDPWLNQSSREFKIREYGEIGGELWNSGYLGFPFSFNQLLLNWHIDFNLLKTFLLN